MKGACNMLIGIISLILIIISGSIFGGNCIGYIVAAVEWIASQPLENLVIGIIAIMIFSNLLVIALKKLLKK